MKHMRLKTGLWPILSATLIAGAIFAGDLFAPAGLAISVLYVAPVALIAMWSPAGHGSLVIWCAGLCSLLILYALFQVADMASWVTLSNHLLAVAAVWMTAVLSVTRKRMERRDRWVDILPRL
jgi:hypothetical protein